jgi:hypothetical protein
VAVTGAPMALPRSARQRIARPHAHQTKARGHFRSSVQLFHPGVLSAHGRYTTDARAQVLGCLRERGLESVRGVASRTATPSGRIVDPVFRLAAEALHRTVCVSMSCGMWDVRLRLAVRLRAPSSVTDYSY